MELIFPRPITPSQRHVARLNRKQLAKTCIIKKKTIGLRTNSGRNHSGTITVKHKGSGNKKNYREIDFVRTQQANGIITSIEHDPNRNTNIASVFEFKRMKFFYILAPKKLKVGNIIETGTEAELHTGNSMPLYRIPEGSLIHNIAENLGRKAQITRAAGCSSVIKEKTRTQAKIRISSKKEKLVSIEAYATLGILSNESYFLTKLGKAGKSRWLNRRPKVRGVAMNPVDHPHGGGEGKKSGKNFTPWGKPNKRKK